MAAVVLEWDVADRMRKALRSSDVGVQEIAEYLGVARNTVSTWINGRIKPSVQTLRLFALRTGVPYEWLLTGQVTASGPDDDGGSSLTTVYHRYGATRNPGAPSEFAYAPNEVPHLVAAA